MRGIGAGGSIPDCAGQTVGERDQHPSRIYRHFDVPQTVGAVRAYAAGSRFEADRPRARALNATLALAALDVVTDASAATLAARRRRHAAVISRDAPARCSRRIPSSDLRRAEASPRRT